MAKNTAKNAMDCNIRAREKYRKKTKSINVFFRLETESDLLEHVEKQENKSGYIKKLIADDIKRNTP